MALHSVGPPRFLLGNHTLSVAEDVTQSRDLGIIMSGDYTVSAQCLHAANKAYRALFELRRTVASRSPEVFSPLYSANVRPLLEYCSQCWSPHLQKYQLVLEKVQKASFKMVYVMKSISYKERLNKLGLFLLERRRKRGDLMEVF